MPGPGEHAELSAREPSAREPSARELGEHFAKVCEHLLAGTAPGSSPEATGGQLAIANALLAVYWELRHQSATGTARPSLPTSRHRLFPRKPDQRAYRPAGGRPDEPPLATEPGS